MDTNELTDRELLARLLGEIAALAGVGAEAVRASESPELIKSDLWAWLGGIAVKCQLTADAGAVLEQIELTAASREGIRRIVEGMGDVSDQSDLARG